MTETASAETTASPSTNADTTQGQATEPVHQSEVATSTEQEQTEQAKSTEPDYSYVPKKFLKDGKPDWEGFSKSYKNLEAKLGTKGNIAPEAATDYDFSPSSNVPFDEQQTSDFKAEAHKAGLSSEQYKFIMGKYEQLMTNMGTNVDATDSILKKEWGSNYEDNVRNVKRAFNDIVPSDISRDDPILLHPTVMKILARVGQELGEDAQTSVKGRNASASGMTRLEIDEVRNSKDYWDNPEKQKLVTQWYERNYR